MNRNTKKTGFKVFLKAGLRAPMTVSTIFPSLKPLGRSLIKHSGMKPGHRVLELGCGNGAVTRLIMEKRKELNSYTGVEIDENLVHFLKSQYPNENFINRSAQSLGEIIKDESIDSMVCTLPWTLFPMDLQEDILREIIRVLKPGMSFSTFLCLHALAYPGAPRVKKLFKRELSEFKKKETITANIPPANVYQGTK